MPRGPRHSAVVVLTVRGLILLAALVVVGLALAGPLRVFFAQRAQMAALRVQQHDDQADIASLRRQMALWAAPGYVAAQAGQRLGYIDPDAVTYLVLGRPPSGPVGPAADPVPSPPWYTSLWQSAVVAGGSRPVHVAGR